MRTMLRLIAVLCLAGAGVGVSAPPSRASTCGFYENDRVAYYNHCGDGWVRIHVDKASWFHDEEYCVAPGVTGLGSAEEVDNAYYLDTDC